MSGSDDQALKLQIQLDVLEIRRLARQIKTKAQFEGIVKGIPDPHMRQEITKLIVPLLSFPYKADDDGESGGV